MTRFAGYSYRGTHPGLGQKEDPLSTNYITKSFVEGGFYGLLVASIGAIRPASRPYFVVNSCKWAGRFTLGILPLSYYWPRWQRSILESNGEKVPRKKQPLYKDVDKWGEDDLAIFGVMFGSLLTVVPFFRMRIFGSPIPFYQKALGPWSIGAAVTVIGVGSAIPEIREAKERDMQRTKRVIMWWAANRQSVQILGRTFTVSASFDSKFTDGARPNAGRGVQTASPDDKAMSTRWEPPNKDSASVPFGSVTASLDGHASDDSRSQSNSIGFYNDGHPASVKKPHLANVREDGSAYFIPFTDYHWAPSSTEDGLRVLREHIKELEEEREKDRSVANQLWLSLSLKERQFYLASDEDVHQTARTEAEFLASFHTTVFSRMADLSWMIADAKKTIKQLETSQALRTSPDDRTLLNFEGLDKAHKEMVAGIHSNDGLDGRIKATQETLKWVREQIKRHDEAYARWAHHLKEAALADGFDGIPDDEKKDFDEQWTAKLKNETSDVAEGIALRVLKQLEADKEEELRKLREKYWRK